MSSFIYPPIKSFNFIPFNITFFTKFMLLYSIDYSYNKKVNEKKKLNYILHALSVYSMYNYSIMEILSQSNFIIYIYMKI